MEQTDLKKKESREQNKEKKPNCVGRFLAVAVLVVMLAAGWFLLLAYVSYNLRLSADVIRAGLVLLYILPCWIGGRVLRRCMQRYTVIYGAVLGTAARPIQPAVRMCQKSRMVKASLYMPR